MPRSTNNVRFRGRRYPVIDRLAVGGKRFLILERLGTPERPIFRAFDRRASLGGEMRCLHLLPNARSTREHLRVLSRLSAPQANLPTILEFYRRKNDVVVVTRWIEGPTLRDYLEKARRGREPWPSPMIVINLIRRLAHACWLLHRQLGLIHGDLKPANLILCRASRQLVPIDYGSAWCVERTAQRETADGKTRPYAAPELLTGVGTPGFRSDQFSVSVVLYEMLTGKVPYDGLGGVAGTEAYCRDERLRLMPPSQILRHKGYLPQKIKRRIDEIARRGVSLDAGDRYPNGREWLDALDGLKQQMDQRVEISGANQWLLDKIRTVGKMLRHASE